jgi:hypothetical protein
MLGQKKSDLEKNRSGLEDFHPSEKSFMFFYFIYFLLLESYTVTFFLEELFYSYSLVQTKKTVFLLIDISVSYPAEWLN